MPNRLVREGFLDSEAINALGDAAECFYHRLLLAADDAGRMDGRADMLRARLFPLDRSRRASDVEKLRDECVSQGLLIPYEWQGKPYLQLAKVQRCSPCVTSKFPWKDGSHKIVYVRRETRDGEKEFVLTSLSLADGLPIPLDPPARECTESGTGTKTDTKTKGPRFALPEWVPETEWAAFMETRKKARKDPTDYAKTLLVRELEKLRSAGDDPAAVLDQSTKRGWLDLFPLKDGRNGSTTNRRNPSLAERAAEAERQAEEHLGPL